MATRITVSLPAKEHAELAGLAEEYDVSLSWLTRKAIVEFLRQQKKEEKKIVPTVRKKAKGS